MPRIMDTKSKSVSVFMALKDEAKCGWFKQKVVCNIGSERMEPQIARDSESSCSIYCAKDCLMLLELPTPSLQQTFWVSDTPAIVLGPMGLIQATKTWI